MTVTERILYVLDRAAAAGADQVVVVPRGGTLLCHPSWDELRQGTEYQFGLDELSGIDRDSDDLGDELHTHTVLLNLRDPKTNVTTTVWRLAVDGGHIRLGANANDDDAEEELDGNES